MKRIGLVGYFKWGNYGDELFCDVLRGLFEGDEGIEAEVLHDSFEAPYFSMPVEERVDEFDAIIIGGGDLIIPWTLSPLYWKAEYLRKPVFVVGVEVPKWGGYNEDVCEKMSTFMQHENVKFIHARSAASADWITRHLKPNVDVYPGVDIVCAIDFPYVAPQSKVLGLVTRANQNIDPANVNALLSKAVEAGWMIKHIPLAIGHTAAADIAEVEDHTFVPRSVTKAESIKQLTSEIQKCQMLVSMKFHGCVVAHMSGIPTITLSKADKFMHFYNLVGRERFLSHAGDAGLRELFYSAMEGVDPLKIDQLRRASKDELQTLRKAVLSVI
ncbi:polysaccharide pyruvyl transferase family protein [Henriciella sp.]|uniref:polysaccharide pyruvyl transferase family protein n=1 Tax=Henriciella sp. TaxID=1968823 RepID=UPI00260C9FD6|nr:polysaccharide pyruvyl transferase family protein [Henriciella sp.]